MKDFVQKAGAASLVVGLLSGCASTDTFWNGTPFAPAPVTKTYHGERLETAIKTFTNGAHEAGSTYSVRRDASPVTPTPLYRANFNEAMLRSNLTRTLIRELTPVFGQTNQDICLRNAVVEAVRDNTMTTLRTGDRPSTVIKDTWDNAVDDCKVKPTRLVGEKLQAGWDKSTETLTHYKHLNYTMIR